MMRKYPGGILLACGVVTALLGCASTTKVAPAEVVPLGNNTYSITRSATNGFTRDTDVLKAQAQEDAAAFCASKGKQLKVISLTQEKPLPTTGFVKAKLVFQALDAGAPELTGGAPAVPAPFVATAEPPVPSVDVLVTELTKLDDLRKKGILTDDEFAAEKKKVLSRSK